MQSVVVPFDIACRRLISGLPTTGFPNEGEHLLGRVLQEVHHSMYLAERCCRCLFAKWKAVMTTESSLMSGPAVPEVGALNSGPDSSLLPSVLPAELRISARRLGKPPPGPTARNSHSSHPTMVPGRRRASNRILRLKLRARSSCPFYEHSPTGACSQG